MRATLRDLVLCCILGVAVGACPAPPPHGAAEPGPAGVEPPPPPSPPPTDPRAPRVEPWLLSFAPALEAEGGVGPHGIVWIQITMEVSTDLGADDITGTCTWTYSDTRTQVAATLAGHRTGSHVHLTIADKRGQEFLVLDGEDQGGGVTGTATLTAVGPSIRQKPPWEGRFTFTPAPAPR